MVENNNLYLVPLLCFAFIRVKYSIIANKSKAIKYRTKREQCQRVVKKQKQMKKQCFEDYIYRDVYLILQLKI